MHISWSPCIEELVVQFYFQLVRSNNHFDIVDIENKLSYLLQHIGKNPVKNIKMFILLYKIIGQTRDIIKGKGEWQLSFVQIYVWYQYYPNLAFFAFQQFVLSSKQNSHPYGSWKDIKTFCQYIKDKTRNENHPLIIFAINLLVMQISNDFELANKGYKISLAGKWVPREKSKYSWLFKLIAHHYNYYIQENVRNEKKIFMNFRKKISFLNRYLKTPQIFMSSKKWRDIDFNKATSLTIYKYKKAFLNQTLNKDRDICSQKFKKFVQKSNNLYGKRCYLYQLVKSVLFSMSDIENEIINKQWIDNNNNKDMKNVIPLLDTSIYMLSDDNKPLYTAIGLGIRISENSIGAFRNRLLIYSDFPTWIIFNDDETFVQKVWKVYRAISYSMSNLPKAVKLILDFIVKERLSIVEVKNLTFVVLTGNHSYQDNYNYEYIQKMFNIAGCCSIGIPYFTPHFIFWNLHRGQYFPSSALQKNVTFLSGYNCNILNTMADYNVKNKVFVEKTPIEILNDILSIERYDILSQAVFSSLLK